jgi:hypothetical protein
MDSVFFGPSDRQATELKFFKEAPITIAELFSWVEDFATNEGLQLVQEAGKDGIVAFRPTISRLEYLVFLALKDSRAHSSVPVHGFHTARVQRAIENVEDYLETTEERVEDIRRKDAEDPLTLKNLAPPTSRPPQKDPVSITVNGNNIQSGATMNLVSAKDPNVGISPIDQGKNMFNAQGTQITATFDLSGTSLGKYAVVVVNPDGQYAWLEDAFTIMPQSVQVPDVVGESQAYATATIKGANLMVGNISKQPSSTVKAGYVSDQDPAGGDFVAQGSAVDLVISAGPQSVQVPDLIGAIQADAMATI